MSNQEKFTDRLIAAENIDARRKERYEMEMQRLINRQITPAKRIITGIVALFGLIFAINSTYLALTLQFHGTFDGWYSRVPFVIAAIFGLAWTFLAGKMAITGRINLKKTLPLAGGLQWAFTLFISIILLVVGGLGLSMNGHQIEMAYMGVMAVAFLIIGAVSIIANKIEQSELKTREQLLGLELKLAELTDLKTKE